MTSAVAAALALDTAAQDLLFRAARTANSFTDEPVGPEHVQAIHDLIRSGPTAYNSQPLRVLLVRSAAARTRLLPHLSSGNRDKTATAPLVAILAADPGFPAELPTLFPHKPWVKDYYTEQSVAEAQARFNATLQAGYFILGVRAAGLAAGPMAGFDNAGVDGEFFAESGWRSLLVVNIGRPGPDAWSERLPRWEYADVVAEV
ncbi:malonic semialdehyde reductase [Hamadaea tsunoensis]|uniref:malonic semialdehyde reductase n=1 Tax=Hamadaea tsunoensis TaxID=53368 RepID=UPI0003F5EEB9|nr:malonic semialdehyde reductase [Hamadaea tsunoensis]